jgi:8-oxo-dGTP diphosphatase
MKRMGAGAVIVDNEGRVLLVNPTYKPEWEIPGGAVELDESPAQACRREIAEELGLDVTIGELLCVDYNRATGDYVESLMFLFRVATLTAEQVGSIRLATNEISEFRFCTLDQAQALLSPRLGQRILAVLDPAASSDVYLEDQKPIA